MEEKPKKLISASGFELERIRIALSDNGIPNDSKPQKRNFSAEAVTGVDNTSIQDIYVAGSDYDRAYDLCVGIGAIRIEGEEASIIDNLTEQVAAESGDPSVPYAAGGAEEFEEMDPRKRTAVRIVSALLLILIAAAVIFCTDFFAGWVKSLFG